MEKKLSQNKYGRNLRLTKISFVPGELTMVWTVRPLAQRLSSFYSKCITVTQHWHSSQMLNVRLG